MKVLYLDESGEPNPAVPDPHYPIFVLGGVIIDKNYADGPLTDAVNDFKRDLFGSSDIILHTADIVRNRKGFESLQNADFCHRFYIRMNGLMQRLQYSVVACAVRKDEFARHRFGRRDLYRVCLAPVVERFCAEIGDVRDGGVIVAESRGSTRLDRPIGTEWLNMKADGVGHMPPSIVSDRIIALNMRRKQENLAGLQLADLVLSPIGRHLLGKLDRGDWSIVASKMLRHSPGMADWDGLIVLP